jgi:hypothetical protein
MNKMKREIFLQYFHPNFEQNWGEPSVEVQMTISIQDTKHRNALVLTPFIQDRV